MEEIKDTKLRATFSYDLLYDFEDEKGNFEKFTRADDARKLGQFCVKALTACSPKPGKEYTVDHINGNCFDCRRKNLRWATKNQQKKNQRVNRGTKSGHRGVQLDEQFKSGKYRYTYWRAVISDSNGKKLDDQRFRFEGDKDSEESQKQLKRACALYRKWNPESKCLICDPKEVEVITGCVVKRFTFTLTTDIQDKDEFDKFTRADDARRIQMISKRILTRKHAKPDGRFTAEHINRNIFDVTRDNLKWITPKEQNQNRRMHRNNSSGHTGVVCNNNAWVAQVAQHSADEKRERFPYTKEGLKLACKYYRSFQSPENQNCPTCMCEEIVLELVSKIFL